MNANPNYPVYSIITVYHDPESNQLSYEIKETIYSTLNRYKRARRRDKLLSEIKENKDETKLKSKENEDEIKLKYILYEKKQKFIFIEIKVSSIITTRPICHQFN